MTGETQLRARRTRIKILRAITEKNGSASFSEIRDATGLSTGSIYYHLQRMSNYVNKDSRHYIITKEGMQMFRQIEGGSPPVASNDDEENTSGPAITFPSDSLRLADPQRNGLREYAFVLSLIGVSMFLVYNLFTSSHIIFPTISAAGKMIANASLISSASIAALLSISFLIMIKRHLLPTGYRGIMLSALTVLSVLLVNILIFSGLGTQIGVSSGISAAGKMIANASLISSASIAALLSISFLIMIKRHLLPTGYRGIMLSALTVLSVLLVNILIFSGLGTQIGVSSGISAAGKMIANASLISSASIAALLSISFLIMIKRHLLPTGYRGIMLSALTVLSVLLVNILIFSGLGTQIGVSQITF